MTAAGGGRAGGRRPKPEERQGSLALDIPAPYLGEGEDWAKARGYRVVIGVDEVGRGPLAGPVVAGAVHLTPKFAAELAAAGLNDSKRLSPERRELLAAQIHQEALVGLGQVEAARIDEINILRAAFEAMGQAVLSLAALLPEGSLPDLILVDGNARITPHPLPGVRQHALVSGDSRSIAIAAASVVAKVHRDGLMVGYDRIHPGYGFSAHKGYLSAMHGDALARLGPCPIHRRSFRGVLADENTGVGEDT